MLIPNIFHRALRTTACLAALTSFPLHAENLIPSGDFEEGENAVREWSVAGAGTLREGEGATGQHAVEITKYMHWFRSPELVDLDPAAIYRLSARVKAAPDRGEGVPESATLLFGLEFYDENGESIPPHAVKTVPNTEAVLARDAREGDLELAIAGGDWKPLPHSSIAFDIKEDFSDIPNRSALPFQNLQQSEEGWTVRLKEPLGRAYPKGTQVRQHTYADLPLVRITSLDGTWGEEVLEVGPAFEPGTFAEKGFWPGAKAIRVVFVPVRPAQGDAAAAGLPGIMIDNIQLTKP